MRRAPIGLACVALMVLLPVASFAQPAAPEPSTSPSRVWLVAGAGSVTVRGDCQTCEEDYPYRSGGTVLANAGYRVNDRADIGGEILWVPVSTDAGQIRVTHFDAIAQFRPWSTRGFFLKGGAGMAFVRNWVDAVGPDPVNSKALSVVIGGGWAFRRSERVGFQIFLSQHAGAIGDLQIASGEVSDVMTNFWTVGAALVFR